MTLPRSFLLLFIVPACATETPGDEPVPFGKEPGKPCAATGDTTISPYLRQHYRYEYDARGNETLRVIHDAPSSFREAHFAEYDGDALVREETRTTYRDTVRVITLDRGRPVDEQMTTFYGDGSESHERWTSTWNFEDSPPSLVERRYIEGLWAGHFMRYRPLVDEVGFTMSWCSVEASDCADFDYVGPYEYVGDERSWTTQRLREAGEPTLLGERTFDANGLLLSSIEYRTSATGTPEIAERTLWRRDEDGTLRGWTRVSPGGSTYRYEAEYTSCATR
jgi:hypothetical protein